MPSPGEAANGRRSGLVIAAIALIGLGIATYLTWARLAGTPPICGPSGGCETVEASAYSAVAGVPVALLGIGYSAALAIAGLSWWRRGVRAALLAAYGLGLAGLLVEAYLVYLEVAVIHAVCLWCAGYGITILAGWIGATVALRSDGERPA